MKKKLSSVARLTMQYYGNVAAEKVLAAVYHVEFTIKNKRIAKKMPKAQYKRFKQYLDRIKGEGIVKRC